MGRGFVVAPRNLEGSFLVGGTGQSPRVLGRPLCHCPQCHLGTHSGPSALHKAAALEGGRWILPNLPAQHGEEWCIRPRSHRLEGPTDLGIEQHWLPGDHGSCEPLAAQQLPKPGFPPCQDTWKELTLGEGTASLLWATNTCSPNTAILLAHLSSWQEGRIWLRFHFQG